MDNDLSTPATIGPTDAVQPADLGDRAPEAAADDAAGTPRPSPRSSRQARWLVAGIALAALAALFWPRGGGGPKPGGFLVDGNGRPTPLAGQLAPVTLLHFWATWCPPCIDEVPAIDRLARDLGGEGEFRLLMVAVDDDKAQVARFAGAARERVLYDPQWEVAHRYGTRQLPETYLLVDGKVTRKFTGATDWDDPQVRALVRGALATVRGG